MLVCRRHILRRALCSAMSLFATAAASAHAAAQQPPRISGVVRAELGVVDTEPFRGVGAEVGFIVRKLEARLSFNALGASFTGCMSGIRCALRDVALWELGLGTPFGGANGRDWIIGVAAGRQTERFDKPRLVWSPYVSRDFQLGTRTFFRLEGRFRAMKYVDGSTLPGGTMAFAFGLRR